MSRCSQNNLSRSNYHENAAAQYRLCPDRERGCVYSHSHKTLLTSRRARPVHQSVTKSHIRRVRTLATTPRQKCAAARSTQERNTQKAKSPKAAPEPEIRTTLKRSLAHSLARCISASARASREPFTTTTVHLCMHAPRAGGTTSGSRPRGAAATIDDERGETPLDSLRYCVRRTISNVTFLRCFFCSGVTTAAVVGERRFVVQRIVASVGVGRTGSGCGVTV